MKNVLWGNGFALLGNFQGLCSSRWEGEHCSLPGNLCTLAHCSCSPRLRRAKRKDWSDFLHLHMLGCPCGGSRLAFGLGCRGSLSIPVAAEVLSTAGFWASCWSPGAALVHLPVWKVVSERWWVKGGEWKVFCCRGLLSAQGSARRVRGCERSGGFRR